MTTASNGAVPVTIRAVCKTYGSFCALDDVSLDIAPGEFITLLGPSGSGKTTLLMVLAGFVRPDSGSVQFGEEEVITKPPHLRDVGMVFQNYALFPHMNVFHNVAYPLRVRRLPKSEIEQRVLAALDLVELGPLAERSTDQLSGGQRQRVALARAVVFEPRVLLMDEPLSALDKKLREQMQIEIRHLHERLGMTTVYVTHDQREALTMSDRVAVINHGGFVQIDSPERLYEYPTSYFVADFIGESSFLPVRVTAGGAELEGRRLILNRPLHGSDEEQYLAVRPEKLEILSAADGAEEINRITGTIREVVYQGESSLVYVELSTGATLAMRQPSRRMALTALPEAGQEIVLGLHPEDTVVVPRQS